jgi:hypothetical protein
VIDHEGHKAAFIEGPPGATHQSRHTSVACARLLGAAGIIELHSQHTHDPNQQWWKVTGRLHWDDVCTAVREGEALVESSREDQIRKMLLHALEASR